MTLNEGGADRVLRMILGMALLYAGWAQWPMAPVTMAAALGSIVFFALGAVAAITSLVGWCPLYALIGLSTRKQVEA
jgi:hypothetical protein